LLIVSLSTTLSRRTIALVISLLMFFLLTVLLEGTTVLSVVRGCPVKGTVLVAGWTVAIAIGVASSSITTARLLTTVVVVVMVAVVVAIEAVVARVAAVVAVSAVLSVRARTTVKTLLTLLNALEERDERSNRRVDLATGVIFVLPLEGKAALEQAA